MEVGFDDLIVKSHRSADAFVEVEQHLRVKFVDECQRGTATAKAGEAAALAVELAGDVVTRLRNAVELGNLNKFNACTVSDPQFGI